MTLVGLTLAVVIAAVSPSRQTSVSPTGPRYVSVAAKRPRKANVTRFIFVRHCEKDVAGQDPPLTAEGQERAKALVSALDNEPIDAIYATEFKRTQMTVQPLAEERHLPVAIVQERNERKFAMQLVQSHKNQSVVIASHVNVIPDVVKHLGVREPVQLEENSYGDIFVVEVDAKGRATMTRSRFGQ
jgi:2,3-bisphosphoglycerate-dependent phosphoglycerate mutase